MISLSFISTSQRFLVIADAGCIKFIRSNFMVFVIRYSPISDIKLSLFKYFSLRPFDALSVLQRLITQIKSLRRLLIPLVQMEKERREAPNSFLVLVLMKV